ncbi:MAG: hypothetical protein H7281_03665 [Bacteriovorax sp.]|nr:hypothetical protein [Bacteriovorax sp.]
MNTLQALDSTFENLTNSLNQFGLNLTNFNFQESDSFKHARDIHQDQLFQINTSLQSYNDLITDGPVLDESEGTQTQRHLRKFLTKYGLTVNERLFNDFADKYLVEVYSLSHQQIYRSINFFNLSSYDLGALTFIPWDKLFYRSEEDTLAMFNAINFAIDNDIEYMAPNIPVHFLTELCSNKKFGYKMIKLASVNDVNSGAPMGYLTVISVKEVLEAFQVLH